MMDEYCIIHVHSMLGTTGVLGYTSQTLLMQESNTHLHHCVVSFELHTKCSIISC